MFITGSDTGVGKTVLTALLTAHLRRTGVRVRALKPFCSGGRQDAKLLQALQAPETDINEIAPWHFAEPVAPLVAARIHKRSVQPAMILDHIRRAAQNIADTPVCRRPATPGPALHARRPILLIEGIGGLLVPLTEEFSVLDLIGRLKCELLVVAPNRLGTLNHSLLTLEALRRRGIRPLKLVFMDTAVADPSSMSNPRLLAELISPIPLIRIPFLRPAPVSAKTIAHHAIKLAKVLSTVIEATPPLLSASSQHTRRRT